MMNPENVCMHMLAEYLMSLGVKHWTSLAVNPGNRALYYLNPKVCRIIAFWAVFGGVWATALPSFGVQVQPSASIPSL